MERQRRERQRARERKRGRKRTGVGVEEEEEEEIGTKGTNLKEKAVATDSPLILINTRLM